MTGPKLNEKATVAGERPGTRATAKYVRTSASKARAVLDLIRGLDVVSADEILRFTDRHVARDVRKVLASAIANAVNNDDQDADELFVLACFADEGPTLRRFRPRARGRATRINKRTCHITVIVARMSEERLEIVQARQERAGSGRGRPQSSAASRRARVERSRQRSAADTGADESTEDESTDDSSDDSSDEAAAAAESEGAVEDVPGDLTPADYAGSVLPLEDASEAPEGYPIKGNEGSMLYHEPGSRYYKATKAELWFDTVESAEAAGFTAPGTKTEETSDADSDSEDAAGSPAEASDAAAEGSASDEAGDSADQAKRAEDSGEAESIEQGSASDEAGTEADPDDDEKTS